MKKIISIFVTTLACFVITPTIQAQTSAGIGLAYGADMEDLGLQLSGSFSLNDKMRVGADLTYYLSSEEEIFGTTIKTTAYEINGNLNYILHKSDAIEFYGIGSIGLHFAGVSIGDTSESDSEIGIGVGVGAQYNLGNVKLFAEPRYFLSGFDQLSIGFGARIGF